MICKDQDHELCRGGTWCDCAHRPTQTIAVMGHPDAGTTTLVHDIQEADDTSLPPWLLDVVDQALERHSTWVRRGRPQRKEEA
jgi:hypothetical protein